MKVILHNSISLNGKIAGKDGNEDFLSEQLWDDVCSIMNRKGCIIWSKKTFEAVKSWGDDYLDKVKAKIILVSRKNKNCCGSIEEAISEARKLGFKEVIISGGSNFNKSIWEKKLADELILNIEPVMLGEGISWVEEGNFRVKLEFQKMKKLNANLIQLYYKVMK